MSQITNEAGFGLSMAVWLAFEDYDNGASAYPDDNLISATALLKPTRRIVLEPRVPAQDAIPDVKDRIALRFGHAIHDSIEAAWKKGYWPAMKALGYPDRVIEKVQINPSDTLLKQFPDVIPVFLEQRFYRPVEVDGLRVVISGKVDQIINGELNDTKTTSVYTYINRSKQEDYILQGSIYRWLAPDKITSDVMRIQHIFTDWQRTLATHSENYPADRVHEFVVELMEPAEIEAWIKAKIREIVNNQGRDEADVVRCNDKELWMSQPTFKYYSDPAKASAGGKSSRNFDNYFAAQQHLNSKKKGAIVTVPSEPKACGYCPASPICSQRKEFFPD